MSVFGLGVGGFIFVVLLIGLGLFALLANFFRQIDQGKAMIINKRGADQPDVTFTGAVVLPIVHKAEVMEISVKTIKILRRGKEGLICCDNIRADIEVTFFVRVNKTKEDVLKVAQHIGCARASDPKILEDLFSAKFSEALKTVGKQLNFEDLYTQRHEFRDQIIEVIGRDLNGYVLEDCAIDYLEQTPVELLDRNNILDAQGIRKITELTAIQHVKTNEYENNEKKLTKKQDVEAAEAIMELDRQQAEALAKQQREILSRQAREESETHKVQAEERLKAELARIKADEEIQVNLQNKGRQIDVAEQNRLRVVGIESEKAIKDRSLEALNREREVELMRIAKDKSLEIERKLIQEVIRERVAVEKTVAEEEERIKTVRVVEEARRNKDAVVIAAEAEAQEGLVKGIKAAEAAEQGERFLAKQRVTKAESELEAAEKSARARLRLTEASLAEAAVSGMASVRVKEADASAVEKVGLAEAMVMREKGLAEGQAVQARLEGESKGLLDKAKSIAALDEAGRGHEEYRLRIDNERVIALEEIRQRASVTKDVAMAQAEVLSSALAHARIDIVGGEQVFFDRMINAIGAGKAVDGFVGRSETVRTALKDYLDGDKSLGADLRDLLAKSGSGEGLKNLTLSTVLLHLLGRAQGPDRANLESLIEQAKSMGVDHLKA